MIIQDIQHIETGQTRQDGHYPQRIGSKVDLCQPPHPGASAIIAYLKDNAGKDKSGYLVTSIVNEYEETSTQIILKTLNSKYVLLKEKGDVYTGVI